MRKARSGAGAYEQAQFERGRRAWRKRVLPQLRLMLFPIFGACLVYMLIGPVTKVQFVAGLLAGGTFAIYVWVRDEPPAHVEHHREGAEGERRTARVIEPLKREGWYAAHNIETGRGNRDHILIGPSGVFLLDSKKLGGSITINGDTVHVERVDNPRDSYELRKLAPAIRGEARRLHHEIQQASAIRTWVTAVVVFWSSFDAGLLEGDRVVFVHGGQLRGWLRSLPHRHDAATVARIGALVD